MPKFNVHLTQAVSAVVTVEAKDYDEAIDLAYESEDMPGSMCYGAFGQSSVDEDGDWGLVLVTDENGDEVWTA